MTVLGRGGRQGERYEDRVQAWGGWLAGVPAGDGDGAGAHDLRVAAGMPRPWQ